MESVESKFNDLSVISDISSKINNNNKFTNKAFLSVNQEFLKVKKKIGEGGFGSVFKGKYIKEDVAIKKFYDSSINDVFKEVSIIRLLKHQNIPIYYGICQSKSNENSLNIEYNIVSELVKGVVMNKYFNFLGADYLIKILTLLDLASVLVHMHSLKLIHRDLKPSNIMIDRNMNLKLLDFGISQLAKKTETNVIFGGTILYMAPENFNLDEDLDNDSDISYSLISTKTDVWAFGCIMSELFTGYRPWAPLFEEDSKITACLFRKVEFHFDSSKIELFQIPEIIKECTNINPRDRLNMKEVKIKLIDVLFKKIKKISLNCIYKGLDKYSDDLSKYD